MVKSEVVSLHNCRKNLKLAARENAYMQNSFAPALQEFPHYSRVHIENPTRRIRKKITIIAHFATTNHCFYHLNPV